MPTFLYILLAALVAAAVAMQVWMARSSAEAVPASRQPLVIALRAINVVALLALAALVAWALLRG